MTKPNHATPHSLISEQHDPFFVSPSYVFEVFFVKDGFGTDGKVIVNVSDFSNSRLVQSSTLDIFKSPIK